MNEQTDPDVLMHGVIAAVGPQALTEMETKRPESAPAASIGHNELFSVTELLAAAPMKFYLAARMKLIELRKAWIAWRTGSALREQSAAAAESAREEQLEGYVGLISIARAAEFTAEELASRAISHFNDSGTDTEKYKAFVGFAPEFLNRLSVNYLGHYVAAFEEHLHESAAMAGVDAAPLDLREIYNTIGRKYPHLRDECRKQNNDRAMRERQVQVK
jgi:hypothetical protein